MDRIKTEQLKILFEAPRPVRKRAFLRKMGLQPIRIWNVLWMQCFYISGWEYILSFILIGSAVVLSCFYGKDVLAMILAAMPMLAVVSVSDGVRSITWGMCELEMSCRFSLKSIVLARMVIAGIVNFVLELFLALLAGGDFCENILYLSASYLVSVYGSLILVRKITGRDGIYACIGFGLIVSAAAGFSALQFTWIYQTKNMGLWLLAVILLAYLAYRESRQNIRRMEEIVWN